MKVYVCFRMQEACGFEFPTIPKAVFSLESDAKKWGKAQNPDDIDGEWYYEELTVDHGNE